MLVRKRRGLLIAAALLGGAAILGVLLAWPVTRPWVQWGDDAANDASVAVRNRPLTLIAEAFSLIGSVWVNWPLRAAAAVLLAVKRRWIQLTAFALAVITSEILIGVLKTAYHRARPPDSLIETSHYSFPSGHAIAGAVTAVGLVLVLLPPGRERWRWEVRAVIFTGLMALSRVTLSAHWLSDAVAGALLGAGLALGWPAALLAVVGRRDPAARVAPEAFEPGADPDRWHDSETP
jgi:undecaprenyl-diphosphatase